MAFRQSLRGSLRESIRKSISPINILDDAANVYAAYSTRRLFSNATLSIRVERSSDNAQQDFGFGIDGFVDDSAVQSFIGGGTGSVVTFYDQGPNENHLTQPAATAPTYTTGFDGKPCLEFNGSTQFIETTTASTVAATDMTVMVMHSLQAAAAEQTLWSTRAGADQLRCSAVSNVTNQFDFFTDDDGRQSSTVAPQIQDEVKTWFLSSKSAAAAKLIVNTNEVTTGLTYTPQPITAAQRLGRAVGSNLYYDGKVGELIIFTTAKDITDIEVNSIRAFLDTSNFITYTGGFLTTVDGEFMLQT